MTVKFNVKLSSEDMYRFNMYHAYTSMQGILSLVMGIFVIVVIALSEICTTSVMPCLIF